MNLGDLRRLSGPICFHSSQEAPAAVKDQNHNRNRKPNPDSYTNAHEKTKFETKFIKAVPTPYTIETFA